MCRAEDEHAGTQQIGLRHIVHRPIQTVPILRIAAVIARRQAPALLYFI